MAVHPDDWWVHRHLLLLAELEPLEGTEGVRILGNEFPHAEELLVIVPPADRL